MSHPNNPPPYEEIYMQGILTHPVQTYPVPYPVPVHSIQNHQMQAHSVVVQPQSQMILHVPVQHQPTGRPELIVNEVNFESVHIICSSCNYTVRTKTEMRPGLQTHLCAACLLITGFIPCCLVPYCIPSCNNVDHYCPNCNAYIGSYTS